MRSKIRGAAAGLLAFACASVFAADASTYSLDYARTLILMGRADTSSGAVHRETAVAPRKEMTDEEYAAMMDREAARWEGAPDRH